MSSAEPYGDPTTRRRILQATWELLEEPGADATLGLIAKRARVSRQAIYLHFGDRSTLFVAAVDFIDESLGRDDLRAFVHGAETGVESLERWVETMSWYTGRIDRVTAVLERESSNDEAMAAAWRDRMEGRRGHIRSIAERIHAEGCLAPGWTIDDAVDVIYVVTMPGPWRELTRSLGWEPQQYADHINRLLRHGVLTSGTG